LLNSASIVVVSTRTTRSRLSPTTDGAASTGVASTLVAPAADCAAWVAGLAVRDAAAGVVRAGDGTGGTKYVWYV
jgi:hypothetical protein